MKKRWSWWWEYHDHVRKREGWILRQLDDEPIESVATLGYLRLANPQLPRNKSYCHLRNNPQSIVIRSVLAQSFSKSPPTQLHFTLHNTWVPITSDTLLHSNYNNRTESIPEHCLYEPIVSLGQPTPATFLTSHWPLLPAFSLLSLYTSIYIDPLTQSNPIISNLLNNMKSIIIDWCNYMSIWFLISSLLE